jgi:hypothetical protein
MPKVQPVEIADGDGGAADGVNRGAADDINPGALHAGAGRIPA